MRGLDSKSWRKLLRIRLYQSLGDQRQQKSFLSYHMNRQVIKLHSIVSVKHIRGLLGESLYRILGSAARKVDQAVGTARSERASKSPSPLEVALELVLELMLGLDVVLAVELEAGSEADVEEAIVALSDALTPKLSEMLRVYEACLAIDAVLAAVVKVVGGVG